MVAEPGSTANAPAGTPPGTPARAEQGDIGDTPRGQRRRLGEDPADNISTRQLQNQVHEMGNSIRTLTEMMQNLIRNTPGPAQGPSGFATGVGSEDPWSGFTGVGSSIPPPPGFGGGNQRRTDFGRVPADFGRRPHEDRKKVLLEEKYFRRIEQFSGDAKAYRSWLFDLMVSIGWVDGGLSSVLDDICKRGYGEKWEPHNCAVLNASEDNRNMYRVYSSELFSLLVSLTSGEAKKIGRAHV